MAVDGWGRFDWVRWHEHWLWSRFRGVEWLPGFMERVPAAGDDECWLWEGALHEDGYGLWRGRLAHRRMMDLMAGVVMPRRVVVRHLCHTPRCVNPAHLATGSDADNVQDMVQAGRQWSKLTEEQVLDVKRRLRGGATTRRLARELGVGQRTIGDIRTGKTWAHLTLDTRRSWDEAGD